MDNILIPILGFAILVLLAAIIFLVRQLKSNQNTVQYSRDATLPSVQSVSQQQTENDTADVVFQINQYIEQGRSAQAIGLLNKAIAQEPQRSDLRLMLLAQFADQNDAVQFEKAVDELHALNDPHAIAQANSLRSSMQPSPSELPVESMIAETNATQSQPTHKQLEDSPLDFDAPFDPNALEETQGIDFDFEPTAEQQIAELETELTESRNADLTATQKVADATSEITFDFSGDDQLAANDSTELTETELSFVTELDIAEAKTDDAQVQSSDAIELLDDVPELSLDINVDKSNENTDTSSLTLESTSEDIPSLELSTEGSSDVMSGASDASEALTLDVSDKVTEIQPTARTEDISSHSVPADTLAVTNEFDFDMNDLELDLKSDSQEPQLELTDSAPVKVAEPVTATSHDTNTLDTFNFDEVSLEQPPTNVVSAEANIAEPVDTQALPSIENEFAEVEVAKEVSVETSLELTNDDLTLGLGDASLEQSSATSLEVELGLTDGSETLTETPSSTLSEHSIEEFSQPLPDKSNDTLAQLDAIFLDDAKGSDNTVQNEIESPVSDIIPNETKSLDQQTDTMLTAAAISAVGLAAGSLSDDVSESSELSLSLTDDESLAQITPEVEIELPEIELNPTEKSILDAQEVAAELSLDEQPVSVEDEFIDNASLTTQSHDEGVDLNVAEFSVNETAEVSLQEQSTDSSPVLAETETNSLLSQLKSEFGFVEDQDAQQTNLELAERYIGLGELMSAKSLLNEVVEAGSLEQQGEAKQLLEKLTV